MKPSTPPPPKPLFLVPKQPNPPSSPIPPSVNPSGTVSGLLYYDRKKDYEEFEDRREIDLDVDCEKEENNFDVDDEECQVHPRNKERFSSMSHYSLSSRNSTTYKYVFHVTNIIISGMGI